jgi:hypothetical protein
MSEPDGRLGHWRLCVLVGPQLNPRGVPMPDADPLLLVTRWRTRAGEISAQAEMMTDLDARQEMRDTAAAYEFRR